MLRIFFSYSHRDEELRDELETHLSGLKRQGIIESWHDRRIVAGSDVDDSIDTELERADIILLLVSPYFIDSDYCYEREMSRALERHHASEAHVIPVILHPCDWKSMPFGELMATPRDGKPVSKFPNLHDAFLQITKAIRAVAEQATNECSGNAQSVSPAAAKPQVGDSKPSKESSALRSSNLRVKKNFTDRDLDRFLDESFEYIARFFEGSLEELENRNSDLECMFKRIDANHFTATIYRYGSVASECRVWRAARGDAFGGGIPYSASAGGNDNSMNDSLTVQSDGHSLFLHPFGFGSMFNSGEREDKLSQQGASEYYWSMLIRQLQ